MSTNGDVKMTSAISMEQVKKEGCLLWAKIRGYSYWPGIVTVDPMDGLIVSESSKNCKVHVHFLGYSNMRGWVELSNILLYEGKEAYDELAAKSPKNRNKDFFPTKKYQRLFEKAVKKAEEVKKMPLEQRLKNLGLVYVLVKEDDSKSEPAPATNGVSTLPKITTGVGFFKSYQPPPETKPAPEKTLDIFDFDDSEDIPASPFEMKTETKSENTKKSSLTPRAPVKRKSGKKVPTKETNSEESKAKKLKISLTDDNVSEMIEDITNEYDEFNDSQSSLGSLVWGRMSGFPYWPCFITKSPGGETNRRFGKREECHAQFFNWNNESGWIQSLPWCSMNEYHSKAKVASPKGANSPEFRNWYPPARLLARWKGAIAEAQKTENMSRRERYNSLVVGYGQKALSKSNSGSAPTVPPKKTVAKTKAVDKACPATKKSIVFKNGLSLGQVELPKGWTYELTEKTTLKFNNPEGIAYDGVNQALAHLMQQNCAPAAARRKRSYSTSSLYGTPVDGNRFGWFLRSTDKMHFDTKPQGLTNETGPLEGPVEYLIDASLPSAWSVRTIRSKSLDLEVLYKTNKFHTFKDKVSLAEFLEGMGHPALEIEQLLLNLPSIAKAVPRDRRIIEDEEEEGTSDSCIPPCTITLSKCSVEEVGKNPQLAKTVVPCYVDMVKLPDIFHRHPCVRVKECNNEMTIRDAVTDTFIAKKIIYD